MIHVHMLCIYVGKTTLPLLQRLRKHGTTADARAEDSSFHEMLRTRGLAEWTPVPLHFSADEIRAGFAEHVWWYRLKRWTLNECAPAVPGEASPSQIPAAQQSKRLNTFVRQLQTATRDRDFARRHAVANELQALATTMQIPLVRTAAVRVPYLTPPQTLAITTTINKLLHSMPISQAQRHAVRARIVIVRTVPLNVRRTFESAAIRHARAPGRPPCCCTPDNFSTSRAASNVQSIRGHFCLLPIAVPHENSTLRSTDPLPLPGCKSHQAAISILNQLARALNVTCLSPAYLSKHLSPTLFADPGALRQRVRQIASALAPHAVIRVVDKGPGIMWGFCRVWAWDELQSFMHQQGYHKETASPDSIFQAIQSLAKNHAWPLNNKARLAVLYLIGKAKSQVQTEMLWRPIAPSPAPVLSRSRSRVAARAFTCFVCTLVSELPACFLGLNLNDMGQWVNRFSGWSVEVIGEADCKEQFNNVHPATVVQHMKEASTWLKQQRRWRAATLGWSIHKENKKLDRAGEAKKSTFDFLSMDALIELVSFSLLQDNVVLAAGEPWRRSGAIQMGGPFSAQ